MYSLLNTISEYTCFYISKNITSYFFLLVLKIVESLQCMLEQAISLQIFQRLSTTNLTWAIFEYFVPYKVFLIQMLFGLNMDIYKILPVNLHIHSEHSKTWKKIKSVSRLFQRNISSREKTRKLVNLFCYKTTVTIKIILTNAKLLLSFINIHLLQSVLLFVNPILIHSLFSKIYSHQGDLIF